MQQKNRTWQDWVNDAADVATGAKSPTVNIDLSPQTISQLVLQASIAILILLFIWAIFYGVARKITNP